MKRGGGFGGAPILVRAVCPVAPCAAFVACVACVAGVALPACAPSTTIVDVCNGHAELCSRTLDQVAFAGSHNAMSSIDDDFAAPNQRENMAAQLELGVRAFLIDTHPDDKGGAGFCHESCIIGEIPIVDGLTTFKQFLDANRGEVIQLLVEDYVPADQFAAAMTKSGLLEYVIQHDPGTAWPTLGELIQKNTRVYIATEHSSPPPAWYHAMYLEFVDTPFSFHTVDDITADASCDKLRGSDDNDLFLINHWVEDPLPDEALSKTVNAHDLLLTRVQRCAVARAHFPNVVAVDFVSSGDLFRVVDELNGF
jgi:hypothetical protein